MKASLYKLPFKLSAIVALLLVLACTALAQSSSLDGEWDFAIDREGRLTIADLPSVREWRKIRVPLSWNAQFADLRDYRGVAWYRKRLTLPALKPDETALLRFGAVDYLSEVFINGQAAGRNEGGYLPFTIDIGRFARAGENEIAVRVTDPDSDKARWGDMNFDEIPHGKQSWYVHTGGIWQPVTLEIKPKLHITNVHVTALTDGRVEVTVKTSETVGPPPPAPPGGAPSAASRAAADSRAEASVIDPAGRRIALRLAGGGQNLLRFSGRVEKPELWSTERPALYTIEAAVGTDRFRDHFGFRSFEARDGRFYLNGEPIYIISALDQDFYPEGIYTPPSYEFLVAQMRAAKRLGLNMLRTHIKVPTPDYLRAADETGVLIWYEVPSWKEDVWTPAAARRGEEIFLGLIERDWNRPSIVIMSIINEAWGARGLKDEETRRWLKEAYNRLRPEAARARRLVVDNSPCCENFHLETEIADFHQYRSIPDRARDWDQWVADLGRRPAWLWSKHGDAKPTGKEPIVLSEFGNWGLPELPRELPWWFDRDFNGREMTRPAGIFDRFHRFKFDRIFSGFNDLARATQRHQWISLKYEIESIRAEAEIQGYTITEFTDLNWECNGLLDIFRKDKIYAADLAKIQQPDVIFTRASKHNYLSGERVLLPLYVSRYSASAGEKLTAVATVEGKTVASTEVPAGARGEVKRLTPVVFDAPAVDAARSVKVEIELRGGDGRTVASNYQEIFVYPRPGRRSGEVRLAGRASRLAGALGEAGYTIAGAPSASAVLITDRLDAEAESHLRAGGRAIILADDKDALPADGGLKVVSRRSGGGLDGNWVTNFNWVNVNAAPFKAVAFDKILGFESLEVVPEFIIQGIGSDGYDDVLAGIFYGWVNQNAAITVRMKRGEGSALVTTLRLADNYGRDPYATHLLDEMIKTR